MTTSRMGIIGSLRVSNFSLPWVTYSPLKAASGSGLNQIFQCKNITLSKYFWREYFGLVSQLSMKSRLWNRDFWEYSAFSTQHSVRYRLLAKECSNEGMIS